MYFFFQAEDGIRDLVRSRGLGDVYKRQATRTTTAEVLSHRSESGLPPSGLVAVIGDGHGELLSLIHI